jgi:chemotaxis protein methyltransferase WspC
MKPVEQWVPEIVGLDAAAIGAAALRRAARLRMKDLGLKRPEDFENLLISSARHREELLETLVAGETWFFREPEAFTALVPVVAAAAPTGARPFRILCLPCATGEEPFSAVMTLLGAGFAPELFRVEGVDISEQALAVARRGSYGKNSFRGGNLGFRNKFFEPATTGFVVCDMVRANVRFSRGNLLDPEWGAEREPYNCIFCRNLLVYLNRRARQRALGTITRLLAPGGVLFLGPAEQPLAIEEGYQAVRAPLAFACRKAAETPAPERPLQATTPTHRRRATASPGTPRLTAATAHSRSARSNPAEKARNRGDEVGQEPLGSADRLAKAGPIPYPIPQGSSAISWREWEEAWQLASSGHLAEAAAVCEAHLRRRRPQALGYYLLGLLREAQGDAQATECYRRALYLEPDHYESLMRMAWLAQQRGDLDSARHFERRAGHGWVEGG